MKTTIFLNTIFILTFAFYILFGKGLENVHDWIFGVAFGVSICNLVWYFTSKGVNHNE